MGSKAIAMLLCAFLQRCFDPLDLLFQRIRHVNVADLDRLLSALRSSYDLDVRFGHIESLEQSEPEPGMARPYLCYDSSDCLVCFPVLCTCCDTELDGVVRDGKNALSMRAGTRLDSAK